jgi:ribosomal protein S18 acetylase RimI-like enzyme
MATIRPATPDDLPEVRRIARSVFAEYGEYGNLLPKFFSTQGVTSYVARIGGEVIGFVMLGFLPWSGGDEESADWIGDLLAIAVSPEHQRRGVGGELMTQAFELATQMQEWRDVREVQLTCSAENEAGLGFFARHGFEVVNPDHGSYAGGQIAVRLARRLSGSD